MKAIVVFCVAALVVSSLAMTPAERKANVEAKKKECQEKLGASEDDSKMVVPPFTMEFTEGAKKILSCVMKEEKSMVDGKFSKDGFMEHYRKLMEGEADMENRMKLAMEVGEKCATEVNGQSGKSEEDMAVMAIRCVYKESKEKGIWTVVDGQ